LVRLAAVVSIILVRVAFSQITYLYPLSLIAFIFLRFVDCGVASILLITRIMGFHLVFNKLVSFPSVSSCVLTFEGNYERNRCDDAKTNIHEDWTMSYISKGLIFNSSYAHLGGTRVYPHWS